jgi:hypothetical protein
VVVSWGVEVGLEAIAVGLFVIDFVLEEEHVLFLCLKQILGLG